MFARVIPQCHKSIYCVSFTLGDAVLLIDVVLFCLFVKSDTLEAV